MVTVENVSYYWVIKKKFGKHFPIATSSRIRIPMSHCLLIYLIRFAFQSETMEKNNRNISFRMLHAFQKQWEYRRISENTRIHFDSCYDTIFGAVMHVCRVWRKNATRMACLSAPQTNVPASMSHVRDTTHNVNHWKKVDKWLIVSASTFPWRSIFIESLCGNVCVCIRKTDDKQMEFRPKLPYANWDCDCIHNRMWLSCLGYF